VFRSELVISALVTRVGWQQPTQGNYAILTGDNLESLSGLYFNSYHPAVSVKNIKETIEDEEIADDDFNTYLLDLQKACIGRVLNGIFNKDEVIESLFLFNRRNERQLKTHENEGKFVYRRVCLANDSSYSVVVNSLSLLFDGAKTFNIYCFQTSAGVLWTKSVTVVAGKETIVNVNDLILSVSAANYKGGDFLIGYFQDDLGAVKAINYGSGENNCAAIFGHSGGEAVTTGAATYDNQTTVVTNRDYGLNIELTSVRDFTQIICRNAAQFDEAVGLQMACNVIESIIHSTRSNSTERLSKDNLQALFTELNQDMPVDGAPYSAGFKNRLKREIQKLNKNFFPDNKPRIVQS